MVFSFDGKLIWRDDKKLHRARRKKCKSWWNPEWRDRILAAMTFLANGGEHISVQLAPSVYINVLSRPLSIEVPVAFDDPMPKRQSTSAKQDLEDDENEPEGEDEDEEIDDDLEDDWEELDLSTEEDTDV